MKKIKIGNKTIGEGVYVIAEFGVNHNGSIERAKEGIRKAADAGCDAIKFQTYKAEDLVVKGTPKFWNWEGDKDKKNQFDAYKALDGFPFEAYPELIKCCEENGIEFISTPFSFEAAKYLDTIGMKAFKVASSDMSHLPYLAKLARFGKPIFLSTGAATLEEIEEAVNTILNEGNEDIILLHCTLCYPTHDDDLNLNLIRTLQDAFPALPVGLSDHSLSEFTSGLAVAAGACVLEKHFTTDKTLPDSADHWLSLDPIDMKFYVAEAKFTEDIMGSSEKKVFDCEKETRMYDKRSIVSKCDIPKGTKITENMITYKRPGTGIWPKYDYLVINNIAQRDILEDTVITKEMIS